MHEEKDGEIHPCADQEEGTFEVEIALCSDELDWQESCEVSNLERIEENCLHQVLQLVLR